MLPLFIIDSQPCESPLFNTIFSSGFDFFSDIFEYMISDYNKDSGKYAEYYTPHSVAKIIAEILV